MWSQTQTSLQERCYLQGCSVSLKRRTIPGACAVGDFGWCPVWFLLHVTVSLKEHFWIPDFCSYFWCLWDRKVCNKQRQLSQGDKLQSFFHTLLCQKPINGQNFCPSHLNPTRDSAESILEFSPTQLRVHPESGNVHVEQQASEDCDWKAGEERPKVAKVNNLSSCW